MYGVLLLTGVSLISSARAAVAGDSGFSSARAEPVGIPTGEELLQSSPEGAPHCLVPQAADERVEHGAHHGAEDGGRFPLISCVSGKGMDIQKATEP